MESGKGRKKERKKRKLTRNNGVIIAARSSLYFCSRRPPFSFSLAFFPFFFFPLSSYLSHYSVLRPIRLDLDEPFANTKRERVKEIEKKVAGEWIPKER